MNDPDVWFAKILLTFAVLNSFSEKNKKEKPIVKWWDMQKTIHGTDSIVMSKSSKSSPKEKPPVLECSDENQPELGQESKPDSEAALNQSTDGLTWLDGLPPNLDGMEQEVFTIEDTVDVNAPYLLDLLNSAPTTTHSSEPGHSNPSCPKALLPVLTAPKDMDWSIWWHCGPDMVVILTI